MGSFSGDINNRIDRGCPGTRVISPFFFEFQNHLVNGRRRRLKVSFQVSFRWCATVNLRIVVNERKVLPLFLRKSHLNLNIHLFGTTAPLSCGPKARLLQGIVPGRESAREGTILIRSAQRGHSRSAQRFGNHEAHLRQ